MKFKVNFKTPDALHYAIVDFGFGEDDSDVEDYKEEMESFAKQYIEYGECLTVEFDTEANTATVCKVK